MSSSTSTCTSRNCSREKLTAWKASRDALRAPAAQRSPSRPASLAAAIALAHPQQRFRT